MRVVLVGRRRNGAVSAPTRGKAARGNAWHLPHVRGSRTRHHRRSPTPPPGPAYRAGKL